MVTRSSPSGFPEARSSVGNLYEVGIRSGDCLRPTRWDGRPESSRGFSPFPLTAAGRRRRGRMPPESLVGERAGTVPVGPTPQPREQGVLCRAPSPQTTRTLTTLRRLLLLSTSRTPVFPQALWTSLWITSHARFLCLTHWPITEYEGPRSRRFVAQRRYSGFPLSFLACRSGLRNVDSDVGLPPTPGVCSVYRDV